MGAAISFRVIARHKKTKLCKLKSNLVGKERGRKITEIFETFIETNVNFADKF